MKAIYRIGKRILCCLFGHRQGAYYEQGVGLATTRHCSRCGEPDCFPVSWAELQSHRKWCKETGHAFDPDVFNKG